MTEGRRRPLVIGHRGAKGVMPENTLPAIAHALEVGCDLIEFDVHLTRDGVPVVVHDPALNPDITRRRGGGWIEAPGPPVSSLTLAELRQFEVGTLRPGSKLGERLPDQARLAGVSIPTLEEVLEFVGPHPDARLLVELKSDPREPAPAALIAAVLQAIRTSGFAERVVLQSFDWRVLVDIAQSAPDIPRSYLSNSSYPQAPMNAGPDSHGLDGHGASDPATSLPEAVRRAGGAIWAPYHRDLTEPATTLAHSLDLSVFTWTVNEPDDIDRVLGLGVDGIITDYPSRVLRRDSLIGGRTRG